jgi:phosphoribosylformylglycinamidine synthase subunit PurQ / glutaminase
MNVKTLILRAPGTNCHIETAVAVQRAGGTAEIMPLQILMEKPERLMDYALFVLPGGFSYGDDISAGKVFSNALLHYLEELLPKFLEKGRLVLGICNGFQVLVKCRLLPRPGAKEQKITITDNDSARFECRWVRMEINAKSPCLFTRGLEGYLDLPVAHGEGKVLWAEEEMGNRITGDHLDVFRYHVPEGAKSPFPHNPNGSLRDIAGLCDPSGQVLGLMPHPERHQYPWQHPAWTHPDHDQPLNGLNLFQKAIEVLKKN